MHLMTAFVPDWANDALPVLSGPEAELMDFVKRDSPICVNLFGLCEDQEW